MVLLEDVSLEGWDEAVVLPRAAHLRPEAYGSLLNRAIMVRDYLFNLVLSISGLDNRKRLTFQFNVLN
jgi:hypothetical protein